MITGNEFTIRIAGEAGQGMQTIGAVLSRLFKKSGYHIFAHQDYMSRIRGGNNFFQLSIAEKPLYAPRRNADIVVALDKASAASHKAELAPGGVLVLDNKKFALFVTGDVFFDAPLYDLAAAAGGADFFVNTVASGVIAGMLGVNFGCLAQVINDSFARKGAEVGDRNIQAAKSGYDFSREHFKKTLFSAKGCSVEKTPVMTGNDAIALGAVRGGCMFFTAYPMSPSTGIMNALAHFAGQCGMVVEQAEDEIAAVNMAVGASFAGARAMTATSGGGFALMCEGVSLAAMTETPVVICVAQRPGPATGFPTRTEQADLDFVLHAGHGEFARVIYSPGTIEEAYYLTVKAFNIAEKFQIPVLILTDQVLADSYRNIEAFDPDKSKVFRYVVPKNEPQAFPYKRYRLNESGISPRAIPSWIEEAIYADSDEHTEEGHITEDADVRVKMVEKRYYKKHTGLLEEIEEPAGCNLKGAELILLGFGSTYGVMREACDRATDRKKTGFIHFPQVWPFPSREIKRLVKGAQKKLVTVENNAGAQLARLIRRETGIEVSRSILRFDGRPFTVDYLLERIKELNKK